ncbi:MAG TPA: glycosyltransferase, partial [Nitrospirota bacterium]|nr:glycosyltransferase [Nitrospirota bacterium]
MNWNGKHHLEECLESLRQQTFQDFEIILVDNGSRDGSVEYIRERYREVKLVPLSVNKGFAGGNNAGIRIASGNYIALLNNDTKTDPAWLENLTKE